MIKMMMMMMMMMIVIMIMMMMMMMMMIVIMIMMMMMMEEIIFIVNSIVIHTYIYRHTVRSLSWFEDRIIALNEALAMDTNKGNRRYCDGHSSIYIYLTSDMILIDG